MTKEEKDGWKELAEKEFAALNSGPITTDGDKIKSLANCIYATSHRTDLTDSQMASNLALLSGMACAVLLDYANLLNSRGQGEA